MSDVGLMLLLVLAVLAVAGRAASGMNIQPWEFFVITGPALASIKQQHIDNLQKGVRRIKQYCC